MELVVFVDERDRELGVGEKLEVHTSGKLHRAISVFVFNSRGELLLQRRAHGKYHAPEQWSNTCCTHPRPGETPEEAAHRRLREEMGFDCPLEKVLETVYRVDVGGGMVEHEFDHVFVGRFNGEPVPDRSEVREFKWMGVKELKRDMGKNPKDYTPWFRVLLPRLLEVLDWTQ